MTSIRTDDARASRSMVSDSRRIWNRREALDGHDVHPLVVGVLGESSCDIIGSTAYYLMPPILAPADPVLCPTHEHRVA